MVDLGIRVSARARRGGRRHRIRTGGDFSRRLSGSISARSGCSTIPIPWRAWGGRNPAAEVRRGASRSPRRPSRQPAMARSRSRAKSMAGRGWPPTSPWSSWSRPRSAAATAVPAPATVEASRPGLPWNCARLRRSSREPATCFAPAPRASGRRAGNRMRAPSTLHVVDGDQPPAFGREDYVEGARVRPRRKRTIELRRPSPAFGGDAPGDCPETERCLCIVGDIPIETARLSLQGAPRDREPLTLGGNVQGEAAESTIPHGKLWLAALSIAIAIQGQLRRPVARPRA